MTKATNLKTEYKFDSFLNVCNTGKKKPFYTEL